MEIADSLRISGDKIEDYRFFTGSRLSALQANDLGRLWAFKTRREIYMQQNELRNIMWSLENGIRYEDSPQWKRPTMNTILKLLTTSIAIVNVILSIATIKAFGRSSWSYI